MKKTLSHLIYKITNVVWVRLLFHPLWQIYITNRRHRKYIKNGEIVLKTVKKVLEVENIFFWLEFGTLLGAYREHDFIKHDCDIDIAVFYEYKSVLRSTLEKAGFKLIREFVCDGGIGGFEQTYAFMGVSIDVYYFYKESESMYCNGFARFNGVITVLNTAKGTRIEERQVKKITFPYSGFKEIMFKKLMFNVPKDTEKHLIAHYGTNFMIPNSKFNSKEAQNVYYYSREERIGYCNRIDDIL